MRYYCPGCCEDFTKYFARRPRYIATAVVEALGKIGMPETLAFLETLGDYPVRMVRAMAKRIVETGHERANR